MLFSPRWPGIIPCLGLSNLGGNRCAPLCVASGQRAKEGWDKISFCNIRFWTGNRFVSQSSFKLLAILPQPSEVLQIRATTAPFIYPVYLSPDRISCSPGWPQTPCAAEDPLASTTSVLGLEACTTISMLCNTGDGTQGFTLDKHSTH